MTFSARRIDTEPTSLVRRRRSGISFLEGGRGLPVLLLHGIPGSALTWSAVGERLTGRYRVIIPDLPGFGLSEPASDDWYMEGQAHRLRSLLDRLDVRELVLAGHDFGGPVALTLRRLYPELKIRGLILTATNLFTDTYVPPPLRIARVPLIGRLAFAAMAGNRLGLRLMYESATIQKKTATWAQFRRHLSRSSMALTSRIFQRSLADLFDNYAPIERSLSKTNVPTLVLWGDRDPFFGVAVGERSRRAIPGSVLRVLPHTGHFVPEEQPSRVADEMWTFLEAV